MGCGIALLVVLLLVGGFVYWGVQKAKAFMEEWGENPGLGIVAMVVKADDTYELVDKDLEAGTLTVKESATGEESVWTLVEFEEGSESVTLKDDKGRIITIGGSSGKAFTITEPSEDEAVEDDAVEEAPLDVDETETEDEPVPAERP